MVLLYKRYGAVVAKTNSYKQIKQKVSILTYRGRMALGSSNTIGMALWGAQDKSILMRIKKIVRL